MTCRAPSALYTLVHADPSLIARLTPVQVLALMYHLRVRADQTIPTHAWRYCGFICGRGWGKSWAIANEINRRVQLGQARLIALVGPTEDRTRKVCVRWLIDASPPWFKAVEDRGGVLWPNGARADVGTAEVADNARGSNYDHAWLTEVAFWPASTRVDCFENVTTATRQLGMPNQIFWDTTSKGKAELVLRLLAMNAEDPVVNPIIRGTIFDHEWYPRQHLRSEWLKYTPGRRRNEEMLGDVYPEAQGALWEESWITSNRRAFIPDGPALKIISLDPATTSAKYSDPFGFIVAARVGNDVYIVKDLTDRMHPKVWVQKVIEEYERGAAGVVIEVTGASGGDSPAAIITMHARAKGYDVVMWPDKNGQPMPPRAPDKIYIREVQAHERKVDRAEPAAVLTEQGRVHMVGEFKELEEELTTWVPGDRKSPNRLDAFARAVLELSGATRDQPVNVPTAIQQAHALTTELRTKVGGKSRARAVW